MKTSLINRPISEQNSSEPAIPAQSRVSVTDDASRLKQLMQSYQAPQQVEYLHLQTEIELLHQELQTLKQQKGLDNKPRKNLEN